MKKGFLIITAIFAVGLLPIIAGAASRNPVIEDFTNDY
jgi:hypothetical protein